MVSLVHAVLLHLLSEEHKDLVEWILREYCHRRGKKQKEATTPLYRLRWALSRFYQEIRPAFAFPALVHSPTAFRRGANTCSQNSG
jgi:hypothetical protein